MGARRQFRRLPGNPPWRGLSAQEPPVPLRVLGPERQDPQRVPAPLHYGGQGKVLLLFPRAQQGSPDREGDDVPPVPRRVAFLFPGPADRMEGVLDRLQRVFRGQPHPAWLLFKGEPGVQRQDSRGHSQPLQHGHRRLGRPGIRVPAGPGRDCGPPAEPCLLL